MFIIRSMSTTDYVVGSREPVRAYHIYLMRPDLRARAFWSQSKAEAAKFATEAAALAERDELGLAHAQVTPIDDSKLPAFWVVQ